MQKPFSTCLSMLEHPSEHMPHGCSSNAPSNARTYGRTDVQELTLANHLQLGIARRGVARFAQLGEQHSRPVAAPRDLIGVRDA